MNINPKKNTHHAWQGVGKGVLDRWVILENCLQHWTLAWKWVGALSDEREIFPISRVFPDYTKFSRSISQQTEKEKKEGSADEGAGALSRDQKLGRSAKHQCQKGPERWAMLRQPPLYIWAPACMVKVGQQSYMKSKQLRL